MCKNCARQYFCELVTYYSNNNQKCERFKSWIQTKNYAEVKYIKEKA